MIFNGKRQSNEVSIDQQSAVKNNQLAQKSNNQETKRLNDGDPIR
jgi:hypothetical protein